MNVVGAELKNMQFLAVVEALKFKREGSPQGNILYKIDQIFM